MALSAVQRGILVRALPAMALAILLYPLAILLLPAPPVADDPAARLAFALPWQLLPLTALFLGVGTIARHRFFHAGAIDGSNPPDDRALQHARAYLQNTLEQFLLQLVVALVLAVLLPVHWLQVLPVLALWFLVCRLLFRHGLRQSAVGRAFGFAGTYYPTVVGYMLAIGLALGSWFG